MINSCILSNLKIETIGHYTSRISSETAFFHCDTKIIIEHSPTETKVIQGYLTENDIEALDFVLTNIFDSDESKERLKYNGKSIRIELDSENPENSTYKLY